MKSRIIIGFTIGTVFIYGIFVGAKKIFPYEQLRIVKNIIVSGTDYVERSPYYYHKKSQFELLSQQNEYEVVMIGDSITDGGLWNELLRSALVQNRGIGGDTTDGVLDRLNSLNPNIKKAFIMIGINDFAIGKSVEEVYENYIKIINILTSRNIQVFVQSTLFTGEFKPKSYNKKVINLNEKLKKFALENSLEFIDLNKLLALNNILEKKYSKDGIHLNGDAYIIWAKEIRKFF